MAAEEKSRVLSLPTIPNDKLKSVIDILYNKWFFKWKTKDLNSDDWARCLSELVVITEDFDYQLVFDLGRALFDELDRREREKKGFNQMLII